MKFCSACGAQVRIEIPIGDSRERHVCIECDTIHYNNPRIITGCLVTSGDKVLLCKRSIEPRSGYWTLPAGFMENGESAEIGAARETWEEAKAKVDVKNLYTVFSIPEISQVYMIFMADLIGNEYAAGEESEEVELFSEPDIPWKEIAFPAMHITLQHYFDDRKSGQFEMRSLALYKDSWREFLDRQRG